MGQHSEEVNPYRSPPAADVLVEPASPPVAWLIVPVVLLYLYGGLLVVHSVFFTFMVFAGCSVNTGDMSHRTSVAQIVAILLAVALSGVHGGFSIAVGRCLWTRRWRRAVVALAGAIVLAATVCTAHFVVRQLPPGEPWPWHQVH